ncbi:MAG TPA: glycoside hydrolase family 44 protein, partial [Opitutaceae bacterium]|nr:glycoside hydrolase family 44 protein [Opitutaceae bacterium]
MHANRVRRAIGWRLPAAIFAMVLETPGGLGSPSITITIDPSHSRAISPWIYGINFYDGIPGSPRNLTLNRAGGNRWTAYNWENNASNAGSDWYYSNDGYLGGGDTPAEAVRSIVDWSRSHGAASLVTLQLQGYVAGDKNGSVDLNDPNHLATRFKQVVFQKGTAFTTTPPTTDAYVYMDEFLAALRGKFSGDIYADAVTPTFVSLDNEPELWPSTHAEIQSTAPDPEAFIQRTIGLCRALKSVAPSVKLFGPVHYGFNGIVNWQNASGFSSSFWFTDKYLQELKTASAAAGQRLLDVYDLHWYSEAYAGSDRITSLTGATLTDQQIQAIVQSPRSLWDGTYTENSWVASYLGGPIRLLDRLQTKIDADWPGTGLAVTEYANGGDNHIAGAIAEADNLGIFGSRGVFAASYWPLSDSCPFILAAFKMYRDYDGNLAAFGDVSIPTVSSDTSKVAVYVSQDSHTSGRYVVVAINRSTTAQDVGFSGLAVSGNARIFRVEGTGSTPVLVGQGPVDLATWVVTLPALSVSTVEIAGTGGAIPPVITQQPANQTVTAGGAVTFTVVASGSPAPTFQWKKNGADIAGATGAS